MKIPIRFEDTIHELNGKLKNSKNKDKNKEVSDVGCLDVDIESCDHGGKEAFVESSVESSSGGLDSMNSWEMQRKEGSGNGVDNEAKGANLNMNSNVVNGKGNEVDSHNRVDGCIMKDVTPMIPKVNTTNMSPTPKTVNVPISTQANPVKQSYAKITTTKFEVLIDNKLKIVPTRMDENGDEYVIFNDEFINEGSRKWNLTLCCYFIGHKMHINFHHEKCMNEVVEKGPWIVINKPLVAQKWDINMSIDKTKPDKLPLWVRLCNLPFEAWSINGISALASRIGKPLIMDAMTASMCKHVTGRIRYARVLIEVQVKKDLPEKINVVYQNALKETIGHKTVQVRYDWTPPLCIECGVFGHSQVQSKKTVKQNEVNQTKATTQTIRNTDNVGCCDNNGRTDDGFTVVFRPKVSSSDDTMRTIGANKNVGVIGEKLNKKEQHKTSINGSARKNTRIDTLSQSNKFEVLNEYKEGELNEMENMQNREQVDRWELLIDNDMLNKKADVQNENSSKEIDDVCDIMDLKISIWNIRGMSSSSKQDEVSNLIREEKLHACVVLETHLKNKHLGKVCDNVFGPWNWFSNVAVSDKGLESSDSKLISFMSFVYADNRGIERIELWRELNRHKVISSGHPWAIYGDFNVTLNAREHSVGSAHMSSDMVEFNDCVNQIEVDDLCCSGLYFTWTTNLHKVKKGDVTGILKKLDKVMMNDDFITTHPSAHAIFMSYIISDHSPVLLIMSNCSKRKKKFFKFPNYITDKKDFLTIMEKGWNINVEECSMYSLVKKMKALKDYIDAYPFNKSLRDRECVLFKNYLDVVSDEEKLLYQKSKIEWHTYGDKNNAFFHKVLKGKYQRSRINSIHDEDGHRYEGDQVANQFVCNTPKIR
ncbi:RNA-directed DNA polymerase, eukaryota, reverse transcriptase zinc-binding domain protein [Tanacetum coccineum]